MILRHAFIPPDNARLAHLCGSLDEHLREIEAANSTVRESTKVLGENTAAIGDNVKQWLNEIDRYACENVNKLLVGNKSDLDGERCVEQALASSKIVELGLTYMEVSAKTGQNIKEFFRELAFVIAGGGKKNKEEAPAPKPNSNSNPVTNQPARPANGNTMKLSSEDQKTDKKKKKCEIGRAHV